MLKIKDDVDLKELEKFGFSRESYIGSDKKTWIKVNFTTQYKYCDVTVSEEDRGINIRILTIDSSDTILDEEVTTLFDLIQAGLVEKVGEDD